MTEKLSSQLLRYGLLFLLGLLLFTWRLGGQEIISFDSRVYLFALEMWRHGLSLFPTTYGQPYPDYPVTSTVLIYFSALLFGGLDKFTAVLPTAIAASLTLVFVHKIAVLRNRQLGFYSVLMLLATLAFFKNARAIALDMYPTVITAACFYLVYSASVLDRPQRSKWVYPLLVLGFMFRGPIGLVIPTGVVCVYYLLAGNVRRFLCTGFIALFLLILCTTGLLIAAHAVGGIDFFHDVWRMEVMGRIDNPYLPFYFYFTESFFSYALSYPFAFFGMLGSFYYYYVKLTRSINKRYLLKLSGWMLVILVGMSVPGDKKVRYILPVAPALALMAGHLWVTKTRQGYFVVLQKLLVGLFFVLPTILFLVTMFVWQSAERVGLPNTLPFMSVSVFFALTQAATVYFYYTDTDLPERRRRWVALLGTICLVVANIFMIEPIELYSEATRDFVVAVEQARVDDKAALAFYREGADGMPVKYVVNMQQEDKPVFVADLESLQKLRKPVYVVTSRSYFQELPDYVRNNYKVVKEGRVGHVEVVVFK